jgi:hypothetical protein
MKMKERKRKTLCKEKRLETENEEQRKSRALRKEKR